MRSGDNGASARVGAGSEIITEAVLLARPERKDWEVIDDLRVTALYTELEGESVCLLSYDICEITRAEAPRLQWAVAGELGMPADRVHVFCTHTHSSSCGREHDIGFLEARSVDAARQARASARHVREVQFLRVDTGREFNINRRTQGGELGAWCLMQSRGCTDDGEVVDGTQWVRDKMVSYGATSTEAAAIHGPFPAIRPNDPLLDLVLFPDAKGGYVAGLVRFTAHAVVCSAGYWRPNLGRDYPGELCDRLSRQLACPILFLQGPCGDHRPRHRDVGIEERDRIAGGLAKVLLSRLDQARPFPFDRLDNRVRSVPCVVREDLPSTVEQARARADQVRQRLDGLGPGPELLVQRKALAEQASFYDNAVSVLEGFPYLLPGEAETKEAHLVVSRVSFGNVHLLNFPGELFSTAARGLEDAAGGPTLVVSFADGVTGYLMPERDFREGGYEWTYAPFTPASVSGLRSAGVALCGAGEVVP